MSGPLRYPKKWEKKCCNRCGDPLKEGERGMCDHCARWTRRKNDDEHMDDVVAKRLDDAEARE